MAESEGERLGKGSAAELLSRWRAAERDHAAAIESAGVGALAVEAAKRAANAARETAEAARLSLEAAQRAEHAARETAEAADVLTATASREQADLDAAVVDAKAAEIEAKNAFQAAQRQGFPKDPG
jgi:protein-tyrosine-phosphatase